jgi:uncharacterized membrane protein
MAYMIVMTALGAAVLALSVYRVIHDAVSYQWLILAYLTVLTGAFTIKIPRVNSKFSASDTFIFINTILFGTAAGVLTAALDGVIGSIRCRTTSQRKKTIPFNMAVLGLSVFAAGELFFRMLGRGPLSQGHSVTVLALVLPVILSASVYYLCNSIFVAAMLALESGENAFRLWREGLFTTLVATLAGAVAGALIAFSVRSITPLTLLIVVPILVAIYFINMIYLAPATDTSAPADTYNLLVTLRPAYRRFHYFMVALGLGFVVLLLCNALREKMSYPWIIVALLAALAGFITVKMPGVNIKFSLADIFVFANTILFGPVVGGITAALDGFVSSMRCKTRARRMEFALFNIAGMALSAYIAGELFFRILRHGPVYRDQAITFGQTFLPALALAISYYVLNTMGVATMVALQAHQKVFRVWRENLLWGMTTDVNCAFGAVFVASGVMTITPMIAIGVLLILVVVYVSLRASVGRMPRGIGPYGMNEQG